VLYCRRSFAEETFTAASICGMTVAALKAAIWRDWKRVTLTLSRLDDTYAAWFRGRDPSLDVAAFKARWAYRGVLCAVQHVDDPAPTLTIHLSFFFNMGML
jgi:hypothetical protein